MKNQNRPSNIIKDSSDSLLENDFFNRNAPASSKNERSSASVGLDDVGGLVVKQQSEYSDFSSLEQKSPPFNDDSTAPYGFRKRWLITLKTPQGDKIKVDSFKSRQHRLVTCIHSYVDYMKPIAELEGLQMKMITLTYAKASDWRPNHIRDFNSWLRRTLGDKMFSYSFVAELQKRGAIHYHLIVYTRQGVKIPCPDLPSGRKNFIPWTWGFSKIETARVPQYLASYVSKEHQKDYYRFPKNARGFGVWVNSSNQLKQFFKQYMNQKRAPLWLTQNYKSDKELMTLPETEFRRVAGKWFYNEEPLTKENKPSSVFFNEEGKIRIKIPLRLRFGGLDIDWNFATLKTTKENFPEYIESIGLKYDSGGWFLHDHILKPEVSFDDCEQLDASSWVQELMEKSAMKKPKETTFGMTDQTLISKAYQQNIAKHYETIRKSI